MKTKEQLREKALAAYEEAEAPLWAAYAEALATIETMEE